MYLKHVHQSVVIYIYLLIKDENKSNSLQQNIDYSESIYYYTQ